ncbi:MAG: alanine racemase, partial [Candidatus Sericytochromatia bacterium]|nr:alanine racemase [Candidatus Sericytochromatia bacterium]
MTLHYANDIPYINDLEPELVNSWLEIDLNAIGENITYLKSLVPKSTKIMSVVKADAYGHGAIEVAFKAQDIKIVDYLGVANIAEAKILRQSGVYLPILVLGSTFDEQLHIALKYNIETTITSYSNIQSLEKIAKELKIKAKVHLKIDSGMGRVGIRPEKLEESLILLKKSENIILIGVFTHFAESENINSNFTDQQINTFENCLKIIKEYGFENFITHSANSSATLICSKSHFDMVREGLAMYGIGDPENEHLLSSLSLKSRIINIKEVPKGSSLGY